jgi:hypothetical protein
MMQKHRISTNIGKEQKVTVELKQDYDQLEILSLKFSQTDVYTSLCADYGVVCGRITANDGFGIPNVRVSIFVPQTETDSTDPVISALYPYTEVSDKNDDNYRYNLLPARKQHGGHKPTGTFPDQSDILTREEVLEVYENYYRYTVKTNESGDFMIWGVPVGKQILHVDLDLSDIGCFSLRPYDFIKRGEGIEKFERYYEFKSSSDIDGLPQIIKYDRTIEVFPFWGNLDLCEIGITRADYDISQSGIRIEPISLILTSTITDDNGDAVKRNGVIRRNTGYKCNLQTTEGKISAVRYTGKKVYGSDGTTLYPQLEYFNPSETIDEDGSAMVVLPMNLEYVFTNEFGEQEITNDTNKGIPTTTIARFKFSLDGNNEKTGTANYLVPQIREYNSNIYGQADLGEYREDLLTTYQFSDVFEDYLNIVPPSGVTLSQMSTTYQNDKKSFMLGTCTGCDLGVPQDVFYKFIFGKVYTVSSFQGSHYEVSAGESFLGLSRRDAFLGLKEIRPNTEDDCTSKANYLPTNFAFRNRIKFGLVLSEVLLFVQYIFTIVQIFVFETIGRVMWSVGGAAMRFNFLGGHYLMNIGVGLREFAMRVMEGGQTILPLTTYPDCEECTTDVDSATQTAGLSDLNLYYRSAEIKTKVVPYDGFIYLVYLSGQTPNYLNTSTTTGTTFLPDVFSGESAKETSATGITESQITLLHTYTNPNATSERRFIGGIYPLVGTDPATDIFNEMRAEFNSSFVDTQLNAYFQLVTVTTPTNTGNSIKITVIPNQSVYAEYVDLAGGPINATENIDVELLIRNPCNYTFRTQTITIPSGSTTSGYATLQLIDCGGGFTQVEVYERVASFTPSTYREYNTGGATTYTNVPAIKMSYSYWSTYAGVDYSNGGIDRIKDLYAVVRLYDKGSVKTTGTLGQLVIEQGCAKYDKFYDETNVLTYLWSSSGSYGTATDVSNAGNPNGPRWYQASKRTSYDYGGTTNSFHLLGKPYYTGTAYVESSTSPGANYTLVATIAGTTSTRRLPKIADLEGGDNSYSKKTKSGLTEIRDGVVTIVPVIDGTSKNQSVIKEWYRRKRVGVFFCGGVTNYSFIDNWLNGVLYFFKFDKRIKWDDVNVLDLNQRGSKYPRELVFYNILDQQFYYRATPYNPTSGFIGQRPNLNKPYREILHPTTFYDVGVRDEFLYEICQDPRIDPTCSVIRDVNITSYQDPANIVEYAINYRLDINGGKFDVGDFFSGVGMGTNVGGFDGDITQLMSINCEAGIEGFDLDSPHYFIYNGELMDPEDPYFSTYFKSGSNFGPTPIDLKLDANGSFIRQCLNFRLGDYSQKVPFYLWDKKGTGFGGYSGGIEDDQQWDRTSIASMKLQRMFSISGATATATNYLMGDGEEEYLLKPMTITHPQYSFTGNTTDMLERFENISLSAPPTGTTSAVGFVEGDIWLHVQSGFTSNTSLWVKDPASGTTYVVVNQAWVEQPDKYIKDYRESFLFQTQTNYGGNKQVLSTPFLFYFGLRPDKTSLDALIKYYGPKGAFPSAE